MDDKPSRDGDAVAQPPLVDTSSTVGRVIIEPMPAHLEDCYEIEPITGGIRRKTRPDMRKYSTHDIRAMIEQMDEEDAERAMR
jgi:hypothetical protein